MVKQAQQFADEDRKRKEEVEVRNNADTGAYQAEKTLRDLGDKVPAEARTEIEGKIATLRGVMGGKDVPDIKKKTEELMQSLQKIGELMYQKQGGPGGATPPPGADGGAPGGESGGPQNPGGETVEGEFREVK